MSLRTGRFRARPIDITKKIPIHVGETDYEYDDEDMMSIVDDDVSTTSSAPANVVQPVDKPEIPIPQWGLVNNQTPGHFRRPASYIRAKVTDVDDFDKDGIDYDMQSDDERFLEAFRKDGHRITDEMFERCIDRLEKETARLRQIKDGTEVFAPPGCLMTEDGINLRPVDLQHVHDHWLKKRQSRGKALLRQFVEPPEMHDPNPKVAFRPRHKCFSRSRRRNDVHSFRKLQEIRSGLERLQMILELTKRRERLKENQINQRFEMLMSRIRRHHLRLPELAALMLPSDPNSRNALVSILKSPRGSKLLDDDSEDDIDLLSMDDDLVDESFESDTSQSAVASPSRSSVDHVITEDNRSSRKRQLVRRDKFSSNHINSHSALNSLPRPFHAHSMPIHLPRPTPPSAVVARVGRGGRVILNRRVLLQSHRPQVRATLASLLASSSVPQQQQQQQQQFTSSFQSHCNGTHSYDGPSSSQTLPRLPLPQILSQQFSSDPHFTPLTSRRAILRHTLSLLTQSSSSGAPVSSTAAAQFPYANSLPQYANALTSPPSMPSHSTSPAPQQNSNFLQANHL